MFREPGEIMTSRTPMDEHIGNARCLVCVETRGLLFVLGFIWALRLDIHEMIEKGRILSRVSSHSSWFEPGTMPAPAKAVAEGPSMMHSEWPRRNVHPRHQTIYGTSK